VEHPVVSVNVGSAREDREKCHDDLVAYKSFSNLPDKRHEPFSTHSGQNLGDPTQVAIRVTIILRDQEL